MGPCHSGDRVLLPLRALVVLRLRYCKFRHEIWVSCFYLLDLFDGFLINSVSEDKFL